MVLLAGLLRYLAIPKEVRHLSYASCSALFAHGVSACAELRLEQTAYAVLLRPVCKLVGNKATSVLVVLGTKLSKETDQTWSVGTDTDDCCVRQLIEDSCVQIFVGKEYFEVMCLNQFRKHTDYRCKNTAGLLFQKGALRCPAANKEPCRQ